LNELVFPAGFMWGTAISAHQTEGDNSNSDWWQWELRPGTPCAEPSGPAIDHYNRFPADVAMLAGLGFDTHRFSVEWARIEPSEGTFDKTQLDHYRRVVEAVRRHDLEPLVTLNHFSLPIWLADKGGWLAAETPGLFERYVRRVVEALGDTVVWYNPINEASVVAFGGYMGGLGFPPGVRGLGNWKRATEGLKEGHRRARAAIKELRPDARVGQVLSMEEWESNAGGRPAIEYARRMSEDVYLADAPGDDYIGVNCYSRAVVELPRLLAWPTKLVLSIGPLESLAVSRMVARQSEGGFESDPRPNIRRTDMGYEYRPTAVAAAVRRVAELVPGKPIIVTEHGVATKDDAERVEFITEGLKALHAAMADGIPLRGYVHWTAFDNFEWDRGYAMKFGLIGVDRETQERQPKPSARFLGDVARANKLTAAK
jgi:beta-glucosidase